eukprot:8686114-Pyramimonas_sp.AAC.1
MGSMDEGKRVRVDKGESGEMGGKREGRTRRRGRENVRKLTRGPRVIMAQRFKVHVKGHRHNLCLIKVMGALIPSACARANACWPTRRRAAGAHHPASGGGAETRRQLSRG